MSPNPTPASQYLDLIAQRIAGFRRDVSLFTRLGEQMAEPLLAGGRLFTPKVGSYWPSEFMHRAGGLMGIEPTDYEPQSERDVAFIALPDPRRWKPGQDEAFRRLTASPAKIFAIGRRDELSDADVGRMAGFTDGAPMFEGHFGTDRLSPLAPTRPFDQLVRGWVTAGEMVGAMTRGGRMPILWMSVWLEGALVRNAAFFKHNNLIEPWATPLFHEEQRSHYVPPLEPGHVAGAFLDELQRLHAILVHQTERLARAGQWLAEAVAAKRTVSMVAVGHSYPMILELADPADCPVAWCPSISDLRRAHPKELGAGDVAIHLGYSPVDVDHVRALLDRGIRFIYTSPYGRPAGLTDHANLLWLDLPWRPGDATVDIPGYSVRLLPMSSSAHTMAYFTLLCELAERMGWKR